MAKSRSSKVLDVFCKGPNKFGQLVVKKLYILGKDQKWLAEECGVTRAYISMILRGTYKPSAGITEKIAQLLEVDVYKLREMVLIKAS